MSHTFHRYRAGDEPVAGYRLVSHLGAGGFGEVWKANAPGGTEVALKIIDLTGQQGVQEFASLRVVKKVRHPNLISLQAFWMKDEAGQIIDEAGEAQHAAPLDVTMAAPDPKRQTEAISVTAQFTRPVELIIAMQLGAMSLHRRLEECRENSQPGVPVAELLEYLEQAARGIDFLNKPIHDLGKGPVPIVHGDIKPHNILVIGDAAVVCDFGLARAVETLRKTSMAPVTVAYAAPESFKGKVTPQTDQYSLAITYVELRTGRLPFEETLTPYQVMEAHVTRMLDFSRLPEPEQQVILRATDPNPEGRWPSSREMIMGLRQAVAYTGELPLRPGEMAFTGGPTPSHSITHRPMARDTDLPTRAVVDPHKDTSYLRGQTPSQLFSKETAGPIARQSDPLAETAMRPPSAAPKKSRGVLIAGIFILIAAVAAASVVIAPKLLEDKKLTTAMTSSKTPAEQPTKAPATKSDVVPATATVPIPADKGPEEKTPAAKSEPQAPPKSATTTPKESPPAEQPPAAAPVDPNAQYIQLVQDKINDREFAAAVDLLDKAPSKLPEFEKEALQKRLRTAFITFIDMQVQRRAFARGLAELDDAPNGIGLTEQDKQQQRDRIRVAWLGQSREEFDNEQFNKAMESAAALLKRFDSDRDAWCIVARSQVRAGDNKAAAASLEKLGKTSDLPAEYQPLHAGLSLLVSGLGGSNPDWSKLLDGFVSFIALEKDTSPPAALALNSWERARLDGLRSRVVENVRSQLSLLSGPQASELVSKLEKLDSSPELQMFKVKSLLEDKKFADARKALSAVSANVPADNAGLKAEIAATGFLIDLRDPATKPADQAKAVKESLNVAPNIKAGLRGELCAAAESLALSSQPALLEPALELNSKAHDADPLDQATATRVAHLLAARLAGRIEQPKTPTKEQWQQWLQECEQVAAAGASTGTTDALNAECLLATNSRDTQSMQTFAARAKPEDAYVDYVQARALRAKPTPDWPQIVARLTKAYADPAKLPPAVAAPYRRAEAVKLLVEAAARKRAPDGGANPAAALASPFADAAAAEEAYKLLQLARTLGSDLETPDVKLPPAQERDLTLNLALASAWKEKPDNALAASLAGGLLKLSDTDLGTNAFPVLLSTFRATNGTDAPAALTAAQRFIELFQKQYKVADAQALEVYNSVIKPALDLAESQSGAKSPPAGLDKFYSVVADFIGHYRRATWPFDKQPEIERLLTKAITLNAKDAKYFTARGAARISLVPANIEGALADAAAAAKIDPNLPAAYGLQGHALIWRSRQQPTREARLNDLQDALAKSSMAVDKAKPDATDRPTNLLYVSMAHLEKANFETDAKVQKEHLQQAVTFAQQAIDLEKAYPDYAYVALANAQEDLAWLVNEESEKNYAAAIDSFSRAIESNLAAVDPWIGRARCFYKAVVDTKINPQLLGRTREEALQSAVSDLEQVRQLNPDLVEPNLWLGKAFRELNKFAESDAALQAAVDLADKQMLPERALYLIEWTRNALVNASLAPEERGKMVRERAERLKTAPDLGGVSSAKQASLLIGDSLLAEKKTADAMKEYNTALASYEKLDATKPLDPTKADGADANLFLSRAFCRLNVPETEWNLAAAEGVIQDSQRIAQLKPGPHFEALASWYAANARSRSLRSTSPTITPQHKLAYLDGAVGDVRKAIQIAPADPGSWEWRGFGARLLGVKISQPADPKAKPDPAALKTQATEARQWIDDAIAQAAKRPDLSTQLEHLQRVQQELDTILTGKGMPRK